MMNKSFKKGAATLTLVAAVTGSGIVGWNAIETIAQGKQIVQTASIVDAINKRMDSIETTVQATQDTAVKAQKDAAVTKEIVKLMSPRFQINAEAVESRVNQEASSTE